MRIIWQILRKDARALRWYLALGAAASLVCGVMQGIGVASRPGLPTVRESTMAWSGTYVAVACHLFWALQAVLAVRQDPVNGAADWRTRPVAWHTLLAAKVAFLALLVAPQIALRDLAAFTTATLPFDYGWRMTLITVARLAVFLLPVALWASLSTRALKLAAVLAAVALFVAFLFWETLPSLWHWQLAPRIPFGELAAFSAAIGLCWRYGWRGTAGPRALAVASAAAFAIASGQTGAAPETESPRAVQLRLEPEWKSDAPLRPEELQLRLAQMSKASIDLSQRSRVWLRGRVSGWPSNLVAEEDHTEGWLRVLPVEPAGGTPFLEAAATLGGLRDGAAYLSAPGRFQRSTREIYPRAARIEAEFDMPAWEIEAELPLTLNAPPVRLPGAGRCAARSAGWQISAACESAYRPDRALGAAISVTAAGGTVASTLGCAAEGGWLQPVFALSPIFHCGFWDRAESPKVDSGESGAGLRLHRLGARRRLKLRISAEVKHLYELADIGELSTLPARP